MAELILNDQNFDKETTEADKPVVVDFWATWCAPCNVLSPILEKLAKEYEDKLILAKVNVDEARQTAGKFGINQIPTVVMFKKGKPISGFIGARPESAVREMLDKMLADAENKEEAVEVKEEGKEKPEEGEVKEEGERKEAGKEKVKEEAAEAGGESGESRESEARLKEKWEKERVEKLIKWYEEYAEKNGFRLNPDRATVERLVKGLLSNEEKYGARYCPCRTVSGNIEEDRPKICPCHWHKEEIEKMGHCHCMLFYKK